MKQITQKYELEAMGGFSDTRLRFFILGFMVLGLIVIPFLGIIASFIVVSIFAIFTAVKINEFQRSNPESILRHRQAMDRLYNYGINAEYYARLLKPYEVRANKTKKVAKIAGQQKAKQISHTGKLNLAPSR